MKTENWKKEMVSVTMSGEDWIMLDIFLMMTTNYRTKERDGWRKLAEEKDEYGCLVWRNAERNADFWQNQIELVNRVRASINAR